MDYQQSLYVKYKESQKLENPQPYEVIPLGLEQFPDIKETLTSNEEEYILIDLPGKLDDDNLIPVIQAADIIAVPYTYEKMTFESSMLFTMLAETLSPDARFLFIPNRVQKSVNYALKNDVDKALRGYGQVTPCIHQSVKYERILTKDIPMDKLSEIEEVFKVILK